MKFLLCILPLLIAGCVTTKDVSNKKKSYLKIYKASGEKCLTKIEKQISESLGLTNTPGISDLPPMKLGKKTPQASQEEGFEGSEGSTRSRKKNLVTNETLRKTFLTNLITRALQNDNNILRSCLSKQGNKRKSDCIDALIKKEKMSCSDKDIAKIMKVFLQTKKANDDAMALHKKKEDDARRKSEQKRKKEAASKALLAKYTGKLGKEWIAIEERTWKGMIWSLRYHRNMTEEKGYPVADCYLKSTDAFAKLKKQCTAKQLNEILQSWKNKKDPRSVCSAILQSFPASRWFDDRTAKSCIEDPGNSGKLIAERKKQEEEDRQFKKRCPKARNITFFKVHQKLENHHYYAEGTWAQGEQAGIQYKNRIYRKALVKAAKTNGFDTNYLFNAYRSVAGTFNIIGVKKFKMQNGFDADVLVMEECK